MQRGLVGRRPKRRIHLGVCRRVQRLNIARFLKVCYTLTALAKRSGQSNVLEAVEVFSLVEVGQLVDGGVQIRFDGAE